MKWLFDNSTNNPLFSFLNQELGALGAPYTFLDIIDEIRATILRHFEDVSTVNCCPKDLNVDQSSLTPLQYLWRCIEALFNRASEPGQSEQARFLQQDVLVYPIVFGTALGEFEPVDVFRISPEETTPIAETAPPECKSPSPELRGATLGAFGGFLDRKWRMSDMLRGRLDGAERLITAILPDSDAQTVAVREEFIKRAQQAIAVEWEKFEKDLNLKPPAPQKPPTGRRTWRSRIGAILHRSVDPNRIEEKAIDQPNTQKAAASSRGSQSAP